MKTLGEFLDAVAHLPRDTELAFSLNGEGRVHLQDVNLSTPDNLSRFFRWGHSDRGATMRVGAQMRKTRVEPSEFDLLMIDVVPPEDFF